MNQRLEQLPHLIHCKRWLCVDYSLAIFEKLSQDFHFFYEIRLSVVAQPITTVSTCERCYRNHLDPYHEHRAKLIARPTQAGVGGRGG